MSKYTLRSRFWNMNVVLGVAALVLLCHGSFAQPLHRLTVVLKPVAGLDGSIAAIDVESTLGSDALAEGIPLSFSIQLSLFGNGRVADRISNVRLTDAVGEVALVVSDDSPDSGIEDKLRHWSSAKSPHFPVTFHYRAAVMDPSARSNPPWGLKASGGGVAGSGLGFLVLPEHVRTPSNLLRWDLSDLSAHSVGVITAGEREVELSGPPDALKYQWMLAGPATVYRQAGTKFSAFALGQPPYDLSEMLKRAGNAYVVLNSALPYLKPGPDYRLLLRAFDYPSAHTGTAFKTGVLLSGGNRTRKV